MQRYFADGVELGPLLKAPAVIYGWDDKLHEIYLMRCFKKLPFSPTCYFVPHIVAMKTMVLESLAYALLPKQMVAEELKKSILTEVLAGKNLAVNLYWHYSEAAHPVLRPFTQALVSFAGQVLERW
ncbi:MAG: hypothetical protein HY537_13370 [Deltaproteobacteria bacterium]|nr:hypothetical protein [Deltaproteobacteria bacterium]